MDQAKFEKLPLLKDYDLGYLENRCGGMPSSLIMPENDGNFKIRSYSIGELMLVHYAKPFLNEGNAVGFGKIFLIAYNSHDGYLTIVKQRAYETNKPPFALTIDKFVNDNIISVQKSDIKSDNEHFNTEDKISKGEKYDTARIEPHFKHETREHIMRRINRWRSYRGAWGH